MLLSLLTGSIPPSPHIPLPLPKEPPAIVKELTTEEKIQTNFYKCDTNVQWIRADNAECLAKTPVVAEKPLEPIVRASGGGLNTYEPGQCVWALKEWRPELPNTWGSAVSWLSNAQKDGWPTGSTPRVGAVGWTSGHVVLITAVNSDGTVDIKDMNGRWIPFEVGYGRYSASKYTYIY